MKKKLFNLSCYVSFVGAALLFSGNIKAQCTASALPYSETFSTSASIGACTWAASTTTTGAGWFRSNTAYAGGTAYEIIAQGNNACAGCVETLSLTTLAPINTSSVTSLQLSFKHKLYITNQATSGSGSGTLKMQTSTNGTVWTDRWTSGYTVSGSGLTSVASGTINAPAFDPSSNDTYVRFTVTGVLFKVWGWCIDDITAVSLITTGVQSVTQEKMISALYPNPTEGILNVKLKTLNDKENVSIKITDILGKQVLNESYKEDIDISHLKNGIYFLSIYKEGQLMETKKVIKE